MKTETRKPFTLVEVVIALAILTMGLLSALALAAGSQQRVLRADKRWMEQHLLTQAVEYYMLGNTTGAPPPEMFSSDEYSVRCSFEETTDLPENCPVNMGNWGLFTMTVSLLDRNGQAVRNCRVQRIMKQGDL